MNSKLQIVLLLTSLLVIGSGAYQQQLIFHEKETQDGLFHEFHASVPDASLYPGITKGVRTCVRGMWILYTDKNYNGPIGTDNSYGSHPLCFNSIDEELPIMSFRHVGAPTTDIPVLSLYQQEFFNGQETMETNSTFVATDVDAQVGSIALTGTDNWLLFENVDFTGKSACIGVGRPNDGFFAASSVTRDLGLSNVRSAIRGCTSS